MFSSVLQVFTGFYIRFKIDNTPMNTLVYKYGETAKTNNVKLDVAVLNDTAATNKDKEMAGSITNIVSGPIASSSSNTSNFSMTPGIAWSLIDPGKRANFVRSGSGLNGTSFSNIDPNNEANWMSWSNFVWNNGDGRVWIDISDKWRLWITPGDTYNYTSGCVVQVFSHNTSNNTYDPLTNSISLHEITTPFEWQIATDVYPAGTYSFTSNCMRVDSDWFFEKVN